METSPQINQPTEDPSLIVLFRGPTASGKSTLAQNVHEGLAEANVSSVVIKKDDAIRESAATRHGAKNEWLGYTPFRGYGATAVNQLVNRDIRTQLNRADRPQVILVEGGARTRRALAASLAGTQLTARHAILDLDVPFGTVAARLLHRRRTTPGRSDDHLALAGCKFFAQYVPPLLAETPRAGDSDVVTLNAKQSADRVTAEALGQILAHLPSRKSPALFEPELAWPHTDGIAAEMAMRVVRSAAWRQLQIPFTPDRRRAAIMRDMNGAGTEFLADKYFFVNFVQRLGYRTPRQTMIRDHQSPSERTAATERLLAASPQAKQLICKPAQGAGGRRIIEAPINTAAETINSLTGDYIIQEHITHGLEVRYARWLHESGKGYRVSFEKSIPKLKGDGSKSKLGLILSSDLSWPSKIATIKQNLGSLDTNVPQGGSIHVSNIGKGEQKTPQWEPENQTRLNNIDTFMRQFLIDLQTAIGQSIPLLCFDIGFVDPSVLDKPYDFARMRDNAIFFECQMPFTMTNYVRESRSLKHTRKY